MAKQMRVRVTGNVRPSLKEKLVEATRFYADHLMSSRLCEALYIHIRYSEPKGLVGECETLDEDERRYPRKFRIALKPVRNKEELFMTLAHELVHVKQFACGELRFLESTGKTKWKGKHVNDEELDYYDHPWEIEAYGREKGLFYRYVEENDRYDWFANKH
jgi:hypothetical protein